jgi:hypothetical protein
MGLFVTTVKHMRNCIEGEINFIPTHAYFVALSCVRMVCHRARPEQSHRSYAWRIGTLDIASMKSGLNLARS